MSEHTTDPLAAVRRLLQVMATLRGPQGCPWDREQTHRSLRPYLLEEAYEVLDAIDDGDDPALREELGDLLLQVVFHARVAAERGAFDFAAVAETLADKLERRHPHVFGGERAETAEEVRHLWHRHKMAGRESALDGVPRALPALQRAGKVGARAARHGFDWHDAGQIVAKAQEELQEFHHAVAAGDGDAAEDEFGDLLFALTQLSRWHRIDPEQALRRATAKFAARFRHMERAIARQGRSAQDLHEDEWWALWHRAKESGAT